MAGAARLLFEAAVPLFVTCCPRHGRPGAYGQPQGWRVHARAHLMASQKGQNGPPVHPTTIDLYKCHSAYPTPFPHLEVLLKVGPGALLGREKVEQARLHLALAQQLHQRLQMAGKWR